MGVARRALCGGRGLYLPLWRQPPVAVRLRGGLVGRYSGRDLFYAGKLAPRPFEGDRPGGGHPDFRPQLGEDIRLAGTRQPPVAERPADPPAVGDRRRMPFVERLYKRELAVRPFRVRDLVHLVLCRQPAVDLYPFLRGLCGCPLPVAEGTRIPLLAVCGEPDGEAPQPHPLLEHPAADPLRPVPQVGQSEPGGDGRAGVGVLYRCLRNFGLSLREGNQYRACEGAFRRAAPFVVPHGQGDSFDRQAETSVQGTPWRIVRDPYRYVRLVGSQRGRQVDADAYRLRHPGAELRQYLDQRIGHACPRSSGRTRTCRPGNFSTTRRS